MTFPVWRKGMRPPEDLPDGRYLLEFEGQVDKVAVAVGAARLLGLEGTTHRVPGSEHSFRIVDIRGERLSFWKARAIVECDLVGFPWVAIPIIIGIIAAGVGVVFVWKSLVEVRRVVESPGGQVGLAVSGALAPVGGILLVGLLGVLAYKSGILSGVGRKLGG